MTTNLLDISKQNEVVYLITKERKSTKEELVFIAKNRDIFLSWLEKHERISANELNDSYLDFCQYDKHTFDNGDTYRITPYQLNSYDDE